MSRLFAFGCSATIDNFWPTWADILGRSFDHYENWAQAGAGNSFMFYSVMECIKRNKICQDDTVIVMWTNIGREDRYVKNQRWITPGNIYRQPVYDQKFVEKFADPTGYLVRDMANIAATKHILESIGCRFHFLSVVPLAVYDDHFGSSFTINNKILKLYQAEFESIRPSMFSAVFANDWFSRPGLVDANELSREYNAIAGPDWPNWDRFVKNDFDNVPDTIKKEIASHNFAKRLHQRTDTHPLPSEHLLYLEQVLPEYKIANDTKLLVQQTTSAILARQKITKWWNNRRRPERF